MKLAQMVLIGIGCASVAVAGPLATDVSAISGFAGTAAFSSGGGDLVVDVDYAVYAPGDYPSTDPSSGSDYVYAYQAFVATGSEDLYTFSVGLIDSLFVNTTGDDATYGAAAGIGPDLISVTPGSVVYELEVLADENSTVLLFTSDFAPTMQPASVLSGGFQDQQAVPSPLPEPSTVALLGVAGLGLLRRLR